jgi:hypothetical protein
MNAKSKRNAKGCSFYYICQSIPFWVFRCFKCMCKKQRVTRGKREANAHVFKGQYKNG